MPWWFRLLFYASLGVAAEIVFTATGTKLGLALTPDMDDPGTRAGWRLKGHSFLWMLPIYGFGLLGAFEPLHDRVRAWPWPARGAVYATALLAIEMILGEVTSRIAREHVWRWTGPGAVRGHIMLSMTPVWFGVGLAVEPLHDLMVR